MIVLLSILLVAAAGAIAAQRRVIRECDDYIAALNEALEEAHREVVMLRKVQDLEIQ